jgi:hypothetical protein
MDYQNSTQLYIQPAIKIGVRQQQRKYKPTFPGGVALWRRAGWVMLIIIPFVLSINIFMVSSLQNVDKSIVKVNGKRHELMDTKIGLLAKRAGMLVPAHMEETASVKLSLYMPSKRQVGHFNRRTGTFNYL